MANPTYFASKDLFPRGADGSPVPRVRNLRIERFFNSHVSYLTSSTYFSLIDYSHIPPLPPSGASTITTTPAMNLPLSLLLFIFTLTQPSLSVVVDTPDGDSTSYGATDPYDGVDPPEPAPPDDPTRSSSAPARTTTASTSAAPARSPPAAAAPLRGKGDPCGPTYQTDFESTLNTCGQVNTTYTHAPSLFGVQCLHANPSWKQHVNVSSCILNIDNLCGAVIGGLVKASQWYWSSGGPNCTAGIWINPTPAAQPIPSLTQCRGNIYVLMESTCFQFEDNRYNVAAVNLQTLPSETSNGSQVDPNYPSYIVVPQTYDNVYIKGPQ